MRFTIAGVFITLLFCSHSSFADTLNRKNPDIFDTLLKIRTAYPLKPAPGPESFCANPTSGGSIAYAQEGSAPFNPAAFSSSASAFGYTGTLEYQWQSSTISDAEGFADIIGQTYETYDPGTISQTTWYRRLARVDCKPDWTDAASSNVVQVTVYPRMADAIDESFWVTDGSVYAMTRTSTTLYLGGNFDYVGPSVPHGAMLNLTTGQPDLSFVKLKGGTIRVAIPDGVGGFYIGGDFTSVNGYSRSYAARINSDGSLHAWNPAASGIVKTMVLQGGIVYIGGDFTVIGGLTRNYLAALDGNTGAATSWNPNMTSGVYALAIHGSNIISAGSNLTALDISSGLPTSWNPNVTGGVVSALAISGNTLYIGGEFTAIGGQSRNRIGAVDLTSGACLAWNPGCTGYVFELLENSGTVYAAGAFSAIGGQSRQSLAAVDGTTGLATSWNPNPNGTVNAMLINGGNMYVGGAFTAIGGQSRNYIGSVELSTGNATAWDPNATDAVQTLAMGSSGIYAGGDYWSIGGYTRHNLAAIDMATGTATAWNPDVNNLVRAIQLDGSNVYIGGDFTMVGGLTRNRLAVVNLTTGTPGSLNPDVSASVRTLTIDGGTLYLGGDFTSVSGQTRNKIAALNTSTGTLSSWDPNANGNVYALSYHSGLLYTGGAFTNIGGQNRNRIAALSTTTGLATDWNPDAGGSVYAILVIPNWVYVGGAFTSIGGNVRNRLARIDMDRGLISDWNPNANNNVQTMMRSGGLIYVGGDFTTINGQSRNYLAALQLHSGSGAYSAVNWNPYGNLTVRSLVMGDASVYAGGNFFTMNLKYSRGIASIPFSVVYWSGLSGGWWNQPDNWSPGFVPSSSLDIHIMSGYPLLNIDYTLPSGRTMTIAGSGALLVAENKTLTVNGIANLGGKALVMKSSSAGTAAIGNSTGTFTGASNVTVERYIPAGRKWRLLCAPLKGTSQNSIFRNWQNNGALMDGLGAEIWGPDGSSDPSNNLNGLALGGSASMRGYVGGWQSVTNTHTSVLFDGTTNFGYALFATGPYSQGSTAYIGSPGNLPAAVATTLSATGTLITGTHTRNLTAIAPGEFFLIGNPYAAPVNPASFATASGNRTNLDKFLYFWDARPGGSFGLGRYVSYDADAGEYSNVGTGTGYPDHLTQIQSGQAFFVRATAAGAASIRFMESSKGTRVSHDMMGNAKAPPSLRLQLWQDSVNLDGAVAYFHAGASKGLDRMDGVKMMNGSDNLGFRRSGSTLVFEYHPLPTGSDTLFVHLGQMRKGAFRLRFEGRQLELPKGMMMRLIDQVSGASKELEPANSGWYDFSVTGDPAAETDRLMIVFSNAITQGHATDEATLPNMIKVFPNPVTGKKVSVRLSSVRMPRTLQLMDPLGRKIRDWRISETHTGTLDIDVSGLAKGVYHLIATDQEGRQSTIEMLRQ